ncbi:hypothetical protein ScPMuIL_014716 [Solemya velum]
MAFTIANVLLMIGMLVTGSINTLSKKAQNDCNVTGYPDHSANNTSQPHSFDHPWFQTLIMFFGETLCLFGLCYTRRKETLKWRKVTNISPVEKTNVEKMIQFIIAVPTICDLIGTSLAGIGLVYVDASVWQMLRGSIIVFAGILSKIFLKRKLRPIHWIGITVVVFGLIMVGCSSVFKSNHKSSSSETLLGILLILGSQAVSATQMVIEETFLKKRAYHPLHVVGLEGSYGILFMACAVLPAMYFIPGSDINNTYENSLDAMYQIANSSRLLIFCFLYLFSIAFYNYFGLAVTRSLTAVHRTLIDACRTILVWVVDLFVFYVFDKNFGEPFDNQYGLLQVDGFIFLMIGTALYNGLLDLSFIPWFREPPQLYDIPAYTDSINVSHDTDKLEDVLEVGRAGNIQGVDEESEPNERSRLIEPNGN